MITIDPISFSALVGPVLGLVDWKKLVRGLANDYANQGARSLIGRLKPTERENAAKKVLELFVQEFLGEVQDKATLSAEVEGYHDDLRRLVDSAAPEITGWLQPETKAVDLSPVERTWHGLGLNPLPADFDWTLVAKNYARDLRRYVKADPALREMLNTALLEQQTELQQYMADTLTRMAGADIGFDLAGYREYLRRRCGVSQLAAMHTSTYDRRICLWNIFVPQSARQTTPLREFSREVLRRLRREGQVPGEPETVDIRRWREAYQNNPAIPVLDILKRERLLVVLGDPGAGKTSLLKYLVMQWVNLEGAHVHASKMPIWIDLKEYAKERKGLVNYCESGSATFRMDGRKLESLLQAGEAAVYLDGLDEIFEGPVRGSVIEEIAAFAARYPKVPAIITSRVVGYEPQRLGSAGFTHATLEDFDDAQILAFLTKWHEVAEEDVRERARLEQQLRSALHESLAVRELAGNPLLLTMMSILNRTQALPRDRVELYAQASRVLLHEWDASRSLPVDTFARQEKEELLRELAGMMQRQENGLAGNLIDRSGLIELFRNFLRNLGVQDSHAKAVSLVTQLTERNFILCFVGADRFSFVHRAFLEYYCAAWFVEMFEKKRTLTLEQLRAEVFGTHWNDESWHEVLRLIAGMVGEKQSEELIVYLMEQDGRPHKLANLMLAAGCLSEIRNRRSIQKTEQELFRTFTEKAIRYDPPYFYDPFLEYSETGATRQKAVRLIASAWRSEKTRAWLERAAERDADWIIRREAIQELARGWKDEPNTVAHLQKRALTDEDSSVRMSAVEELARGWSEDPAVLLWLKEHARADENWAVRRAAVQELAHGWKDDAQIVRLIKDRARSDENHDVRSAAVEALAREWKDDPETLSLVKERARSDENYEVRKAAVQELARGWKEDPETYVLLKERARSDEDSTVRRVAVQMLARGWKETLPWLKDRVRSDRNHDVRITAAQEIARGWKNDADTLPWLKDRVRSDKNYDVRRSAVQELAQGWKDDPETVPLLRDRAHWDDNYDVRIAALQELARGWKDDAATLPLLRDRARSDANPGVRRAALQELAYGWNKHPGAFDWLSERARSDEDSHVRREAIQELVRRWREHPDCLSLVRERVRTDKDNHARRTAVQELARGWPNDPDTLPLLRDRARSDRGSSVRRAALREMARGWREHPETLAVIKDRALTDGTAAVRSLAVHELATRWRGDPEMVCPIRDRGALDGSSDVRLEAVQGLARGWKDDPETLPWLKERARVEEDNGVRSVLIQEVARGWKDDPDTLQSLKDRATIEGDYGVLMSTIQELAGGWKDDPEVRELM